MTDEIELVSDDESAIVIGSRSAVERFLTSAGLMTAARPFDVAKLGDIARFGAGVADTMSNVAEQSALYLKLTPESAQRLREAGGLMPTKTKGISHVMLGKTGKKSLKWLQAESGSTSDLANPAVLAGVGGLLSQYAQQAEAQALKDLVVRIDEKLDDVRRAQRDAVLARMNGAADAIAEATTIRDHGGDAATWWGKVKGASETLFTVQNEALLALRALAEKVEGKNKTGELKKAVQVLEREVAVQLAVLARCFELQDELRILELDHVLLTAPSNLNGHRLGVADARATRRAKVLESTTRLMTQMDVAGGVANSNVLLHAREARAVIDSLNSTAAVVDDFHSPLGIASTRDSFGLKPWLEALKDPAQRVAAGKEAAQKATYGLVAAVVVVGPVLLNTIRKGGKPPA